MSRTICPWGEPLSFAGIARHSGPARELWAQHEYYVTKLNPFEGGYQPGIAWQTTWYAPDSYLLPYVNSESVQHTNLVVWYHSVAHHDPRDEDRAITDGPGQQNGITLIHWSGFEMHPHNFFDYNPLGGPEKCGP